MISQSLEYIVDKTAGVGTYEYTVLARLNHTDIVRRLHCFFHRVAHTNHALGHTIEALYQRNDSMTTDHRSLGLTLLYFAAHIRVCAAVSVFQPILGDRFLLNDKVCLSTFGHTEHQLGR